MLMYSLPVKHDIYHRVRLQSGTFDHCFSGGCRLGIMAVTNKTSLVNYPQKDLFIIHFWVVDKVRTAEARALSAPLSLVENHTMRVLGTRTQSPTISPPLFIFQACCHCRGVLLPGGPCLNGLRCLRN